MPTFGVNHREPWPQLRGFVLFWVLQIPWLCMTFSMTFGLAVTFETFLNFDFRVIFWPSQAQQTQTLASNKMNANINALFNFSSLCYWTCSRFHICNNSSSKQTFTFPWLSRPDNKIFMNFQAWKMKFLNSITLRKQPSLRDARGGFPAK